MSIHRFLQESAFTPEHVQAMGKAFDETLSTLGIVDRDDPITELVAEKIIETAREGERDSAELRDRAVFALTVCWH